METYLSHGQVLNKVDIFFQQEARREEMLVNRLMRQSQQERRIAVQLLQARHEKEVIRKNRIIREKQYEDRRLKDFVDALNREAVSIPERMLYSFTLMDWLFISDVYWFIGAYWQKKQKQRSLLASSVSDVVGGWWGHNTHSHYKHDLLKYYLYKMAV